MGKRSCFVPGCKTGYGSCKKPSDGQKRNLFTAQNIEQLEKWRRAIPRVDKVLSLTDAVCNLHFTEDDIDRYYETPLPDGTVWKMEKGRPSIKKDAVPTLFPNLPSYLSKIMKKRKPPAQRDVIVEKKIKLEYDINIIEMDEIFTFGMLVSSLESVSKPSVLWGITAHDMFVMCAKWNENLVLEKRVTVDYDLKVRIFLKDREVHFQNLVLDSVMDLSSILKRVDAYVICLGVDDVEKTGCNLYLPANSKSRRCEYCRLVRNREVNKSRKKELYYIKKFC